MACNCRYVSLFPLLMGLLEPSSPELGQQLKLLQRPDLLWTPFGLRYWDSPPLPFPTNPCPAFASLQGRHGSVNVSCMRLQGQVHPDSRFVQNLHFHMCMYTHILYTHILYTHIL